MARRINTQLVIEGKDDTSRAMKQVQKNLDEMNRRAQSLGKAIGAGIAGLVSVNTIRFIAEASDNLKQMEGRLRLVTESQDEFNKAQDGLRQIARDTQSALEPVMDLYTKMIRPLKEVGRTQEEALTVTRAVSQAFSISGTSSAEAANGVTQLSQALAVGVLRGQDFNSVAAFAPRLMQAFADSLGVPQGQLKELAAQGVLTTEVIVDALTGQADVLEAEFGKLPDTVSGALTVLQDEFAAAVGGADTQPLVDALKKLADLMSEDRIAEGITAIANAIVYLAGSAVNATGTIGSEVIDMGDQFAVFAATLSGSITEIDKLERELKDLERGLSGSFMSKPIFTHFMTDDEIKEKIRQVKGLRDQLIAESMGISLDEKRLQDERQKEIDAANKAHLESVRKHSNSVKTIQRELLEETKTHLKELVKAEKEAQKEVEKARKQQLDTEKRYKDALAILRGDDATGGDPSFAKVQGLQADARQKLIKGDIDGAKKSAQDALEMLVELKEAGENSYGFAGIALQLQEIEKSADKMTLDKAEAELESVRVQMEDINNLAEELKSITIGVEMDQESFNKVKTQLESLGGIMGKATIVPELPAAPGFASGGLVRGAGTGTSDSIMARLSNGEYVMRAAAVQQYGKTMLDNMNGLKLPKFNTGGMVGDLQGRQSQAIGTVNFHLPSGDSFSVGVADGTNFDELKRAALKYGRTKA